MNPFLQGFASELVKIAETGGLKTSYTVKDPRVSTPASIAAMHKVRKRQQQETRVAAGRPQATSLPKLTPVHTKAIQAGTRERLANPPSTPKPPMVARR